MCLECLLARSASTRTRTYERLQSQYLNVSFSAWKQKMWTTLILLKRPQYLERSETLKHALTIHQAVSTRLPSAPMFSRTLAKGKTPSVCVIGGGFAGMRCAAVLMQHGVDITIVEARNRLGGRVSILTPLVGDLRLFIPLGRAEQSPWSSRRSVGLQVLHHDLVHPGSAKQAYSGPNWIHGTDHNPIMDLAVETGTITHSWGERQAVIDEQGHLMSEDEVAEYSEAMWATIADAFRYSESSSSIPPEQSLMDFLKGKMKENYPDGGSKDDLRKREAILRISEMWGAFVGTEIQRQSLRFFWLEEGIEGKNLFVASTYEKILRHVCASVTKARIKLDHRVVAVESEHTEGNVPKVKVKAANGWQHTFDEVVVTAPLGWLKRNKHVFEPPLPSRLSKAIDAIGYGRLDKVTRPRSCIIYIASAKSTKVYITFPSAFWDESLPSQSNSVDHFQPSLHSAPNTTATTAPLHHPNDATTASTNHYPGFTHWMRHSYAPKTNPHGWNIEGCNLASLPPSCAHPTLLFYIFDPCSSHIANLISSSPSPSHTTALLTNFFQPYFSRLPNYSPTSPSCIPSSIIATAWANDEFAGYGSYSNFQVGLEEGDKDIEVMREGMPERRVWLAGEHTAPFVALGTTTGAWWSGEKVAERILRAYGLVDGYGDGKESLV